MSDKKNDVLGDKVKELESVSAKIVLDENQPICVRLDGKSFHSFTKGLNKPYDERLSKAMIDTMNYLVEKTNARIGYTQSDEITLVYFKTAPQQQTYFGSRVQKLTSILASMATAKFNYEVNKTIPEKKDVFAFFDCRVWNVPTLQDVADVMIWRQEDAIKNSINMAAHSQFGDKKIFGKNSKEKVDMLKKVGIDWMAYPEFFKSGTYAIKKNKIVSIPEELKEKKENEGKNTFLRSYIDNFHLKRLRYTENPVSILFDPVFEVHKEIKEEKEKKNNRKKGI
jgi:tRNA(His) 5'-end guanylyltransferase